MMADLLIAVGGLFLLGAILTRLIHLRHRSERETRRSDWLKYWVFMLIVTVTLAAGWTDKTVLAGLLLTLASFGSIEISRPLRNRPIRRGIVACSAMLLITVCLGHLLVQSTEPWFGYFAFVFLLAATMDGFSQLWGRLIGQRRITPRISSAKTWEGFLGGMLSTVSAALVFGFLIPTASDPMLALLGLIIALSATAGDLLFSVIKRMYAIKDYSSALPGHGGILDRFDSLIFAAPVFYWTTFVLSIEGGLR